MTNNDRNKISNLLLSNDQTNQALGVQLLKGVGYTNYFEVINFFLTLDTPYETYSKIYVSRHHEFFNDGEFRLSYCVEELYGLGLVYYFKHKSSGDHYVYQIKDVQPLQAITPDVIKILTNQLEGFINKNETTLRQIPI